MPSKADYDHIEYAPPRCCVCSESRGKQESRAIVTCQLKNLDPFKSQLGLKGVGYVFQPYMSRWCLYREHDQRPLGSPRSTRYRRCMLGPSKYCLGNPEEIGGTTSNLPTPGATKCLDVQTDHMASCPPSKLILDEKYGCEAQTGRSPIFAKRKVHAAAHSLTIAACNHASRLLLRYLVKSSPIMIGALSKQAS